MANSNRLGMDHYMAQIQKNPNFDFNRKTLRDDSRRARATDSKDEKQESFREILNRVSMKKS